MIDIIYDRISSELKMMSVAKDEKAVRRFYDRIVVLIDVLYDSEKINVDEWSDIFMFIIDIHYYRLKEFEDIKNDN